jgi:hypothetical protein
VPTLAPPLLRPRPRSGPDGGLPLRWHSDAGHGVIVIILTTAIVMSLFLRGSRLLTETVVKVGDHPAPLPVKVQSPILLAK